jgi:predicted aspartyl protease
LGRSGDVHFLVDTGADGTLLSPTDALFLGVDPSRLPPGPPTTGVGGITPTVQGQATVTLDTHALTANLRILAPQTAAQSRALARIPSLLGRDLLAHFALVVEQRTGRILLLEPDEADALHLP